MGARTSTRPGDAASAASRTAREDAAGAAAHGADRIVRSALLAGLALAAAQSALHLLNGLLLDGRVWAFDLDADGNALSWLSSMATFTAALAAFAVALAVPPFRVSASVLAVVLAFFSLDDVVAIHEHAGQHVRSAFDLEPAAGRLFWPAVFFPLLGLAFLVLLRISRSAPPRARWAIRLALLLFFGALVAEVAWAAWGLTGGETGAWPDVLQVTAEEGAELVGWFLVAGGLAATAFAAFVRGEGARRDA